MKREPGRSRSGSPEEPPEEANRMTIVPLQPAHPPAVVIRVALEDALPRVGVECVNEAEAGRLADWINSQQDLQDLVAFALCLEETGGVAA
jgi:hypothetical protein